MKKAQTHSLIFIFCVGLIGLGAMKAYAQPPEKSAQNDTAGIPDYSVTVIAEGEVASYGSGGKEESSERIFEAGSNGKVVTAYLVLKLVQEGKLSLDAPIAPYLSEEWKTDDPRFPEITVRQLLSHTAGFSPSYEFGVDKALYFSPGSRFRYSGVGFLYLQQVIEAVTGQSFETAVQASVFEPLQMTKSTFAVTPTTTPHVNSASFVLYTCVVWLLVEGLVYGAGFLVGLLVRFQFYQRKTLFYGSIGISYLISLLLLLVILPRMLIPFLILGLVSALLLFVTRKQRRMKYVAWLLCICGLSIFGLLLRVPLPIGPVPYDRAPNAAYTLNTCTKDLALFAQELLQVKESGTPVMKELFTEQVSIDNRNGWGARLAIEHDDAADTYWHSGINPGMQSLFVLCPEKQAAVVVLTNSDAGLEFAKKEARSILQIDGVWDIVRTDMN